MCRIVAGFVLFDMKIRLVCLPAPDSSVGRASDSRFMGPRHKSWSGLLLFLLSLKFTDDNLLECLPVLVF